MVMSSSFDNVCYLYLEHGISPTLCKWLSNLSLVHPYKFNIFDSILIGT